MAKLRFKDGVYCGTLAAFTASPHKFKEGDLLYVTDTKELRVAVAGALFTAFKGVSLAVGLKQATLIAAIGATTPLTAIGATFADLAAARTAVNQMRTDAEARLEAIEAKVDALLAALKVANLISST